AGIPAQAGDSADSPRITVLPRTNFQLDFIWQPVEKSKRKTKEDWATAINNYGLRQAGPSEELLKQEGPPPTTSPAGASAPASEGPPAGVSGANPPATGTTPGGTEPPPDQP